MAKSTKYTAKVPKLEDYKPSWLKTNDEGEQEVDVAAALKAAHTLTLDKAKAQDAREDAVAEKTEVETERDELQEKVDDKNAPDAAAEIAKANKRADTAEATAKAAVGRADRLEVAAEKGLTPAQAKRLQGETKEELESDADEILEIFGTKKVEETDEEREEREAEEAISGRTTPVVKTVVNGGDPKNGGSDANVDFEAAADKILSGQFRLS